MTEKHPITPPPELVVEWADTVYQQTECDDQRDLYVATQAARWGADQELEACCEWLEHKVLLQHQHDVVLSLRAARRPKLPSLKEQALKALDHILNNSSTDLGGNTIRRALEQLDD